MKSHWYVASCLAVAAAGTCGLVACGDTLNQTSASQILASSLDNPANAQLLVTSAITDFQCMYAQYIVATGLVSDEMNNAQLAQVMFDFDRRQLSATNAALGTTKCEDSDQFIGVWVPMSIARFQGDQALTYLSGWTDAQVPNREDLIAQAAEYTGYVETFMGETMCAGAINGGAQLTPDSLLGLADAHFATAITNAATAGDQNALNMALLGRARERLDRGQVAGADSDATAIPAGFEVDATYDGTALRRENRVWTVMWRDYYYSIEGPFRNRTLLNGAPDPRVVVINSGIAGQDGSNIWQAPKYPAVSAPIPIAHYTEAQLIIAEADLDGGNVSGAVNIINALESAQGNTTPYTSMDPNAVRAQLVNERAAELFLEGHRLADIIRYNLTLNPPAGTPYPEPEGGTYGSQLCFPLPTSETLANPNIS
jgi:starch-binding outer membrane protein, SusD/RagB family